MTNIAEALWPRICGLLTLFWEKLAAGDPSLVCNIGRTSNDAFPLRAFLAICRSLDGAELSITVDVRDVGVEFRIESDVCFEDGRIIANGPIATFQKSQEIDSALEVWLDELDEFLQETQPKVAFALAQLG
jgi:hypothetical protein